MNRAFLVILFVSCTVTSCLLVPPVLSQSSKVPHTIHGFITDAEGVPVYEAVVYINNTRTSESLVETSDLTGAYSIDISAFPSGYFPPPAADNLSIAVVYKGNIASTVVQVNSEPTQLVSLSLSLTTHIIKGTVLKPDITPARTFSVNVTNTDTGEVHFTVTNTSGQYRIDLAGYENGYSIGDGLIVTVDYGGFTGAKVSIVTNASSQVLDIMLVDVIPPDFHQLDAPLSAVHDDEIHITVRVLDNLIVQNVFIHYWDINMDGYVQEMTMYAPGRYEFTIPAQGGLGTVEFYLRATDGGNFATLPAVAPPGYSIDIIDSIAPIIGHTPFTQVEAGVTLGILADVTDDLGPTGIHTVSLNYSNVGAAFFDQMFMIPTGEQDEYGATLPAQNQLGTLRYNISASDISGNTATLPGGNWNVTVVDTTPPSVTHVPINSANVGDTIPISATITDLIGVGEVYLDYTNVTGSHFNVTMTPGGSYTYNIPAQGLTGTLSYFIWANDTEGNVRTTPTQDVQINDAGTPVITHAPVETVEVFNVTNVTATISDDVAVTAATLTYMQVNATSYESVPMAFAGGEWIAEIPSQGELGVVKYYINATDGTNNITHPAMKPNHNLTVVDTTPPNVTHGPITFELVGVGHSREVNGNVFDNYNLSNVKLYFKGVINVTWDSIEMVLFPFPSIDGRGNGTYYATIPPQTGPGLVHYYFWANDSSGNNITEPAMLPKLNAFNYSVFDLTRPEILYSPPESINVNETLTVIANVTDNLSVNYVEASYKGTEDSDFTTIRLLRTAGTAFSGQIPAQNVSGILQVYISAYDSRNSNNTVIYNIIVINILPVIEHEQVHEALIGRAINLLARVSDDLHVDGVELKWRVKGGIPYTSGIMTNVMLDAYATSIGPFDEQVTIQYHIEATDREGNSTLPETGDFEIEIGDTVPPVITHTKLTNLTTGSLPIITCEVTDDVNVAYVIVYYTNASSVVENSIELMPVSGGNDQYAIVLGKQPKGEFAYHLEASDGINTVRMPGTGEFTVEVTVPPGDSWGTIMLVIVIVLLVVAALVIYQYRRKTING